MYASIGIDDIDNQIVTVYRSILYFESNTVWMGLIIKITNTIIYRLYIKPLELTVETEIFIPGSLIMPLVNNKINR